MKGKKRDRVAKEARDDNHSVIANHFDILPQVVCECWYGEVMKQSRSQLAMKGADWRDRVAKEARDDGRRSERSLRKRGSR